MKKSIRKNMAYYVFASLSQRIMALFSTGALMQTFLLHVGFSSEQAYAHATVIQAVNVVSILLCSNFANKGNIRKRFALLHIPIALAYLLYLPLCFTKGSALSFVLLFSATVIEQFSTGMRTVLLYKLPYFILTPEDYGNLLSFESVFSACASAAVGRLFNILSKHFDYSRIMLVAFAVSVGLCAVCAFLYLRMKILFFEESETGPKRSVSLLKILKLPVFYLLMIPNFMRGVVNGISGIVAIVAIANGYNEGLTTNMVTVSSAALLLTSVLFGLMIRKIPPKWGTLIGSIFCLAFPVLLIKDQPLIFLIAYLAVMIGCNLVDIAVPASLMYVVPIDIAGSYHAWRMALLHLGSLTATFIASYVPATFLFLIAMVCQLIIGASYCFLKIMRSRDQ